MGNYNYYAAMEKDIATYLEDEFENCYSDVESLEELEERLNDDLWTVDSVTGNGSGSYTFNRDEAKEFVLDNMELCIESLKEFCVEAEAIAEKFLSEDWEYFDVTIRCYILGSAINNVLIATEDDFNAWLEEKQEEGAEE